MRQFVSSANPDKNGLIVVEGKDFRYFRQVLRLNTGDMLSVRIPDGQLVNTTVCKIDDKKHSVIPVFPSWSAAYHGTGIIR